MPRRPHQWVLAGVCLVAACSLEQPRSASAGLTPAEVDTLATELIARGDRSEFYRTQRYDTLADSTRLRLLGEWRRTDSINVAWLEHLVDRIGWPGRTRFGDRAALAALLIVQYADHDPGFQARALPMLQAAADGGEASRRDVAFLTDRLRVRAGRPQVYGTQYDVARDSGGRIRYRLPVVEDLDGLEARRAEAGLPPWREYEAQMAELQGREPALEPRSADRP